MCQCIGEHGGWIDAARFQLSLFHQQQTSPGHGHAQLGGVPVRLISHAHRLLLPSQQVAAGDVAAELGLTNDYEQMTLVLLSPSGKHLCELVAQ